jgi:hypothetical protein
MAPVVRAIHLIVDAGIVSFGRLPMLSTGEGFQRDSAAIATPSSAGPENRPVANKRNACSLGPKGTFLSLAERIQPCRCTPSVATSAVSRGEHQFVPVGPDGPIRGRYVNLKLASFDWICSRAGRGWAVKWLRGKGRWVVTGWWARR